jgi:DNA-directed RNA polymerase subunit RPC12/RpoP
MKVKFRDENGNLYYTCWYCKKEFNFKAIKYLTESKDFSCPECDKRIKLS